ncbi:MAG: HlyD family efflux transporter periplasmic adaptor subunit [Steroidobacteraceae bacterium]
MARESSIGARRGALALAALLCAVPLRAAAHEGHDHAEEAGAAATAALPPSAGSRAVVELTSETYEALLEVRGEHLRLWLDRWASNEPVPGAKIEASIGDAKPVSAHELAPGIYEIEAGHLEPGRGFEIALTIAAAPGDDLLGGTLEIPAEPRTGMLETVGHWVSAGWRWALALAALVLLGLAAARFLRERRTGGAAGVAGAGLAGPGLALLGSLTLALALASGVARAHEGHDHAEEAAPAIVPAGERPMRLPDGSVYVPKATQRLIELRTQVAVESATPVAVRLGGELVGDPRASALLQTLQGGRVVAHAGHWPVLGARVRRGEVVLRLQPSGSAGERASTAAEAARAQSELAQAQAELARIESLPGIVSRAELDTTRARVRSLELQRAALAAPGGAGEGLASPIDGIIAAINVQPGQVVAPGESLVTIIDPSRMSVDALAFEPIAVGEVTRATVALRDGTTLQARLAGVGAQLKGGAIPVRLDLLGVAPGLVAGQPVVAYLERTLTARGLLLPAEAVVHTPTGEYVVYEKTSAERFVPRSVRMRPVSGASVAVLSGLESGARAVVQGASLIAQIR